MVGSFRPHESLVELFGNFSDFFGEHCVPSPIGTARQNVSAAKLASSSELILASDLGDGLEGNLLNSVELQRVNGGNVRCLAPVGFVHGGVSFPQRGALANLARSRIALALGAFGLLVLAGGFRVVSSPSFAIRSQVRCT